MPAERNHGFRLSADRIATFPLVKTAFIKPEWVDDGRADEYGHAIYNNEERNVQVGYWKCTPFVETIVFPYDELGCVIAGRLGLEDADNNREEFGPGEMFFIPRNRRVTWQVIEDIEQFYMIYAPSDAQYFKF